MILSIDPGVNNCGLAVIDLQRGFEVLETRNVKNVRRFTDTEKEDEKVFGTRTIKVNHIVDNVKELLKKYPSIDHVSMEAPFYSVLTPAAYGSLLEVISAIKYTILVPMCISFKMVEPLLVKRMFINVKLDKDMRKKKEIMRDFLEKRVLAGEIVMLCERENLTEHEVDAIAVGYSHHINLLKIAQNENS